MRKLLIAAAAVLALSACQTVSDGIGNAVNIVNAVQGAIQQTCRVRVEYSFIEKLIVKYTNVGAKVETIVSEVCNAIDPIAPPSARRRAAPPRASGAVIVRGVVVKYTRVP